MLLEMNITPLQNNRNIFHYPGLCYQTISHRLFPSIFHDSVLTSSSYSDFLDELKENWLVDVALTLPQKTSRQTDLNNGS